MSVSPIRPAAPTIPVRPRDGRTLTPADVEAIILDHPYKRWQYPIIMQLLEWQYSARAIDMVLHHLSVFGSAECNPHLDAEHRGIVEDMLPEASVGEWDEFNGSVWATTEDDMPNGSDAGRAAILHARDVAKAGGNLDAYVVLDHLLSAMATGHAGSLAMLVATGWDARWNLPHCDDHAAITAAWQHDQQLVDPSELV